MADDIDISGMPDPGTIGLSPAAQVDPTASMPDPHALFEQHHGYPANSDEEVAEYMRNPEATPDVRKAKSAREGASLLTGLPRAAATGALAVPAAAASVTGQLSGALGAALDPDHAGSYLEQGRERGRKWAEKTYKLADYVPATGPGAELSESLMRLPGQAGSAFNQGVVKPILGENAAQEVGDIAQDVATDLPVLGVPGVVRGAAKGAKTGYRALKAATTDTAAPEGTSYDTAGNAETANPVKTPPVGKQVTGESLRAAPNPIPPPEGTAAHARAQAAAPLPQTVSGLSPEERAATVEGVAARRDAMTDAERAAHDQANRIRTNGETKEQLQARLDAEADARGTDVGPRLAGGAQRGSVRLFNSPKEEGPRETPTPEEQSERQGHLDALDTLSGGQLPSRRTSALTGDYNATGNDWQMKEVGNAPMQQQIASENAALHSAAENVHKSIGSEFEDSVDPTVLGDRGRVTRGAIQGIEKHFDDATDAMYDHAREQNQGRAIPALARVKAYLDDDSNFANDAEIGLQRAGKQRLERLWTTGDPDKGVPPGSVNAAEKFREFLNEKGKNPAAMGVANELKGHTDMDVAEHGGPGMFEAARALRRHKYQMLEEPTGIKKLLTPGDSQGINHAIPEHKVMDYIADLPREQHEQVMNVLRAGAHLDPELAEHSAAAIREIQAHTLSRLHDAATDDGGKWNARAFYSAASRYGRNAASTFRDRPDVLNNLKTINDAGNTLHMDKHYPGASAQGERTGAAGHALEVGGALASGMAHHVPVLGRSLGRIIEAGVEKATGKLGETSRDKEVMKRLVDRNGKQRGSVQVMSNEGQNGVSDESVNRLRSDLAAGRTTHMIGPDGEHMQLTNPTDVDRPAPKGFVKFQKGVGVLDRGGLTPTQTTGLVARAEALHGFDKTAKPQTARDEGGRWTSNAGMSDKLSDLAELEYDGLVNGSRQLPPGESTQRQALANIASRTYKDDPRYSAKLAGEAARILRQRGSVRVMNEKTPSEKERNPRSEYNANRQIAGGSRLTPEQEEIIRKLGGGQRGSVRVMNPGGDAQTELPAFKAWSNHAPLVSSSDAASKEFKSGQPIVVEAYHGTKRPDRIGDTMKRSRATSGPMPYHTSSPELASNYAKSKQDTSMAYEDQSYENWFKYRPVGAKSDVSINRMWHYLDPDIRKKIYETAPTLHQDDENNVVSTPGNKSGTGSYDYNLKQARGNPLKALTEDWLNSGNLFGREDKFMDVLHKAGVPKGLVKFDDPNAEYPFVYRNYIHMNKPLVTSDMPKEVTKALNDAASRDRSKAAAGGADLWDKNTRTLREWVDILNSAGGEHAWTSIPDKATAIFKRLGYDGIVDKSGKNGGPEHPVYVPFTETQVKSAIGNKGTFDRNKKSLTSKNDSIQNGALA